MNLFKAQADFSHLDCLASSSLGQNPAPALELCLSVNWVSNTKQFWKLDYNYNLSGGIALVYDPNNQAPEARGQ